jgi:hypothetical protein
MTQRYHVAKVISGGTEGLIIVELIHLAGSNPKVERKIGFLRQIPTGNMIMI